MTVHLTRDSVCAGDDGHAPHARTIASLDVMAGMLRVHFSDHARDDPDVGFNVLRRLTLRAREAR